MRIWYVHKQAIQRKQVKEQRGLSWDSSIARKRVNMLSFFDDLNQFKCGMNIYVQTCAYGMYTSKLYKESK